MSRRDPRITLAQIRDAAAKASALCAAHTLDSLLTDWQAAATRVGSLRLEERPMTTVTLQIPDEVFAAMREDPAHFGS